MDIPSKVVIDVLTYLLPGLIAAAILYVLTPAVRPAPFERTVQALIYTIVIQTLVVLVRTALVGVGAWCCAVASWSNDVALIWSVILAVVVGLLSAWADNTDAIHSRLRKLGITLQTSYPSEWYGTFSENRGYVVLHLCGARRLYGWAEEWPSSPERGHFVIVQGEWLNGDERVKLRDVDRILIRAVDVEMVEMMTTSTASTEDRNGGQEAADTGAIDAAGTDGPSVALSTAGTTANAAETASASASATEEVSS